MMKISFFEKNRIQEVLDGLRPTDEDQEQSQAAETKIFPHEPIPDPGNDNGQCCLTCSHSFLSRESQVEHYKSNWHRYNLKLQINGALPVAEDKFIEVMDEISSISGSDSESENDLSSDGEEKTKIDKALEKIRISQEEESPEKELEKKPQKRTPKIFLKNSNGQLLSIYKSILQYKDDTEVFPDIEDFTSISSRTSKCCIILLSAGHFAAGIFEKDTALVHKTFHRYVLRAKQGTVQSVRDKQGGGSAPKSGGASLRRYNEAALTNDIQTLLNSWNEEFLSECTHIFLRAPHYSKSTFYNGKTAPLDRKDTRINGIPFPTRRPTFNELIRVQKELYSVEIHNEDQNTAKIEKNYRKTKDDSRNSPVSRKETHIETDAGKYDQNLTTLRNESSPQAALQSLKKNRKKRVKHDQNVIVKTITEVDPVPAVKVESEHENITDELFTVCKMGDLEGLKAVLESIKRDFSENCCSENPDVVVALHLNQTINKTQDTLLHIVAKAGHRAVVWYLLEFGADPGIKNQASLVPYSVSCDKPTRNTFRRFMAQYPEKYDYKTAQIPAPLTEEAEQEKKQKMNDKKKAQKALKKERMKELRAEKDKKDAEKQEKERFAALSDREKRAIAAERRFAQQLAEKSNSSKRCWLCGESLLGKVPFGYFDYQFCTIACLKKHKALENVNK